MSPPVLQLRYVFPTIYPLVPPVDDHGHHDGWAPTRVRHAATNEREGAQMDTTLNEHREGSQGRSVPSFFFPFFSFLTAFQLQMTASHEHTTMNERESIRPHEHHHAIQARAGAAVRWVAETSGCVSPPSAFLLFLLLAFVLCYDSCRMRDMRVPQSWSIRHRQSCQLIQE